MISPIMYVGRSPLGWVCRHYCKTQCQDCDACRGSHPDLMVIEAPEKGYHRVDVARQICEHLTLAGHPRGVLLHAADRMNQTCANALLKILEEPPEESLIVLATLHPRAILPTLRSRLQRVSEIAKPEFYRNKELGHYLFDGGARPSTDLSASEIAVAALIEWNQRLRGGQDLGPLRHRRLRRAILELYRSGWDGGGPPLASLALYELHWEANCA